MTLTNLRRVIRAMVPGAIESVLGTDNVLLDLIINTGVRDVTSYCECLPANIQFDATDAQGDISDPYLLSTAVGDFLNVGAGGLWWNESGDSDAPTYKKLAPRTVEWLDSNRPNWHEITDGTPTDYAIQGNNLYVIPAPDADLTDGFWMFYNQCPPDMTTASQFPFSGSSIEYKDLTIFDFSIIYYARWKILAMLSKDYAQDEFNRNQNLYIKERAEKLGLWRRRPDIAQTAMFQGPAIR